MALIIMILSFVISPNNKLVRTFAFGLIGQKVCVAFLVNPNKLEIPWTNGTHSKQWHPPIAVRYYQHGYSALSYGKIGRAHV